MKIGERGQVTIPKDIRQKYGLLPHMEVEFIPDKFGVLIRKKGLKNNPVDDVYGILNKRSNTDAYIAAIRGK